MPILASDVLPCKQFNPFVLLAENQYDPQFEPNYDYIPFSPPPQLTPPAKNNSAFPPQLNTTVPGHGGTPGSQDASGGGGGDSDSDSDIDSNSPINQNEAFHPPGTPIDEADMERFMNRLPTLEDPHLLFQNTPTFSWTALRDRLAEHEEPAFEFLLRDFSTTSSSSSSSSSGVPSLSSLRVNCRSSGGTSMSASVVLSTHSPTPGATAIGVAGGPLRRPERQGQVFLWLVPVFELPRRVGGRA